MNDIHTNTQTISETCKTNDSESYLFLNKASTKRKM